MDSCLDANKNENCGKIVKGISTYLRMKYRI